MSRNRFILLFATAFILLGIVIYIVVSPNKTQNMPTDGTSTDTGIFPIFGNKKTTPAPNTNVPNNATIKDSTVSDEVANTPTDPLFRVSKNPVAGATSIIRETVDTEEKTIESIIARYVNRESGFVSEKDINKLSFEKKLSTTTIPQVEDAVFLDGGNSVALRYLGDDLKTIKTFLGTLPKETTGGDSQPILRGSFLTENIKDFSKSVFGEYSFYLFPSNGGVSGTLTNSSTLKKTQFFESPFHEWTTTVSKNGLFVFVTTKPSGTTPGYSYRLTVPQNNPVKILGGILGLTIQPNNAGNKLVYADNTLLLRGYDLTTKKTTSFGIKTLPEKCVWATDNITIYCFVPNTLATATYPDTWYQGAVSFSDSLWEINASTGSTAFIENISTKNKGVFDATKPFLSPDDSVIFFINKNNYELWGYKLSE